MEIDTQILTLSLPLYKSPIIPATNPIVGYRREGRIAYDQPFINTLKESATQPNIIPSRGPKMNPIAIVVMLSKEKGIGKLTSGEKINVCSKKNDIYVESKTIFFVVKNFLFCFLYQNTKNITDEMRMIRKSDESNVQINHIV